MNNPYLQPYLMYPVVLLRTITLYRGMPIPAMMNITVYRT
jgi:hypothetical protein